MEEDSLKQKTIKALIWNLLDRFGQQVLLFVVGILVANILSVEDYSLVGMLAIFSALGIILLDSGFGAALIQKQGVSDDEYSSIFWFNLLVGAVLYVLLVACSPLIAAFFGQPRLVGLSAVIFLALPLNGLSIIQTVILNKTLRFKQLAKINLTATVLAGLLSLLMAALGCGVWTLAVQPVLIALIRCLLLWRSRLWKPRRVMQLPLIHNLFGFASGLLAANLINTLFLNVYSVILGKLFPLKELGYYTQGTKMSDMLVSLLYISIQNATYPIFSLIQDDRERLLRSFRKTIRFTSFLTFPVMVGLLVIARPLIQLLLKEAWWPAIPYFQLLCVGGCFTILTAINNNFLKVCGRTRSLLKIETFKVALTAVFVLLTFRYPALLMVMGMVATRLLVYVINTLYTSYHTDYLFRLQLKDVLPYGALALLMGACIYPLGLVIHHHLLLILAQVVLGAAVYGGGAYLTGSKMMKEMLQLLHRSYKKAEKD